MCAVVPIMLAMTAISGAMAAKGAHDQGKTAQQVGRNNQVMAEYAAQDAQKKGDEQAAAARRRGDQIKGAQRASMAAKGLDLGVGTAAELQDQTDFFSEGDQQMARFNAKRDAWSMRAGGQQARAAGNAANAQGNLSAVGTVIGTAGQVAGKWYDTNSAAPKGP